MFHCSFSPTTRGALLVLLAAEAGVRVGDFDGELAGALDDRLPLPAAHAVRNLGGEGLVLHEQHLELCNIVNEEALQAVRAHVLGLLVGAVADAGHEELALEAATHPVVDALRLAPALVNLDIAVRLVANELLSALLHNLDHF